MTTTPTRSRRFTIVMVGLIAASTWWSSGVVSYAGAFTPDPPDIPFAGQVIDVDREYTVLAGGGIDNLNADETIEDSSVTAWVADDACGDRDDPGFPTGPIILQALALANGSDQPFLSRKVFVGPEFAGKLLCLDQGIGISTADDYYRLYSSPRVYLLRPPPAPTPDPAPAPVDDPPAPVEEPPAPEAEPAPQSPRPNPPPVASEDEGSTEEPDPSEGQPRVTVPPDTPESVDGEEATEPPTTSVQPGELGTVTVDVSAAGGEIDVGGVLHTAMSNGDSLPPGTVVRVIGVDGSVLVVEAVMNESNPTMWLWFSVLGLLLAGATVTLVWWVRKRRASSNGSPDGDSLNPTDEQSPRV